MINLQLNSAREFKVGEVVHLRVTEIYQKSPGWWTLKADDVTPLPGAEPTGYGCGFCGVIVVAKEDGALPEGWTEKKYEEGSNFACPDCQDIRYCRICGCTDEHACETDDGPCQWVEADLCSACVKI